MPGGQVLSPGYLLAVRQELFQIVRGTLQNDGRLIVWANGTEWTKVPAAVAGA